MAELVNVTTMPFWSVSSEVPVNVAVIMLVVNVPVSCSDVNWLSVSLAMKLELDTVPEKSISPATGGAPGMPYSCS